LGGQLFIELNVVPRKRVPNRVIVRDEGFRVIHERLHLIHFGLGEITLVERGAPGCRERRQKNGAESSQLHAVIN